MPRLHTLPLLMTLLLLPAVPAVAQSAAPAPAARPAPAAPLPAWEQLSEAQRESCWRRYATAGTAPMPASASACSRTASAGNR